MGQVIRYWRSAGRWLCDRGGRCRRRRVKGMSTDLHDGFDATKSRVAHVIVVAGETHFVVKGVVEYG
jgi:hypothetical protein